MNSFTSMNEENSYSFLDQDGGGRKKGGRKGGKKSQTGGAPSTNISNFVDLAIPFALLWANKGIEMIPKSKKSQSGGGSYMKNTQKRQSGQNGQSGGFMDDEDDYMQDGGYNANFNDILDDDDDYDSQNGGKKGRGRKKTPANNSGQKRRKGQKGGEYNVKTNASLFSPSDLLKSATEMASRAFPNNSK